MADLLTTALEAVSEARSHLAIDDGTPGQPHVAVLLAEAEAALTSLTITQPIGDDPLTARMGGGGPMMEFDTARFT